MADFGLVAWAGGENGSTVRGGIAGNPLGQPSHSQHTQEVGTALYMSPEQSGLWSAGGAGAGQWRVQYDGKVDVFALGVMFVELLYPIRTQMERVQVLRAARQSRLPRELETDSSLVSLLHDPLAADPRRRPDAKLLLERVQALYSSLAAAASKRQQRAHLLSENNSSCPVLFPEQVHM